MSSPSEVLGAIRGDDDVQYRLAVLGFDVTRGHRGDDAAVSSGCPLDSIAGDFSGGTFYLCGDPGSGRPVLYASSDGQAGLIAESFRQALELIVGLPVWAECLGFSGGGDLENMNTAAGYALRDWTERKPEVDRHRAEVAQALSINIMPPEVLVVRLHAAAHRSAPD